MSHSVTSTDLRDALSRFASGVVIVAAETPEGPVGFTASAFSSVSLDPPLILVCIGKSSSVFADVVGAPRFGISILQEKHGWIAKQFALRGDRFAGVPLAAAPGVPWVAGALAHFACEPDARHDAGDHVILVGKVVEVQNGSGQPLIHYERAFGGFDLGCARARSNAIPPGPRAEP